MQQMCSYTIERHCCSECSAEIDKGRSDPRIRVEGFIGKTNRVALTAGEPFDENMQRVLFIGFFY
jgi:hypothetical protein